MPTLATLATLTTLVSFNSIDGQDPTGSLIEDASGDLFGTTSSGGANGDGTVFEIAKTATSFAFASTPTMLLSFNGTDGAFPFGSLTFETVRDSGFFSGGELVR
jgi:uncharacterized repeat protein (TIGR03803 family)